MIRVVGLDLSVSTSGIAEFAAGEPPRTAFATVKAPPPDATVEDELERMLDMGRQVVHFATYRCQPEDDVLFVFEGPAPDAAHSGKKHERAGLWWLCANTLRKYGRLCQVRPNTLKSYWTNNGNAPKELMLSMARRRYPNLPIRDHNVADALALAHMGARKRGIAPMLLTPEVWVSFLDGIHWPHNLQEARQ